jgi:hypothetical protein
MNADCFIYQSLTVKICGFHFFKVNLSDYLLPIILLNKSIRNRFVEVGSKPDTDEITVSAV